MMILALEGFFQAGIWQRQGKKGVKKDDKFRKPLLWTLKHETKYEKGLF